MAPLDDVADRGIAIKNKWHGSERMIGFHDSNFLFLIPLLTDKPTVIAPQNSLVYMVGVEREPSLQVLHLMPEILQGCGIIAGPKLLRLRTILFLLHSCDQ